MEQMLAMMGGNTEQKFKLITLANGMPIIFMPPMPSGWESKNVFDLTTDERPQIKALNLTALDAAHSPCLKQCCLGADYLNVMRFAKNSELGSLMAALKQA